MEQVEEKLKALVLICRDQWANSVYLRITPGVGWGGVGCES